jgi:carbon-monoxide dehydrogenase medium subunit
MAGVAVAASGSAPLSGLRLAFFGVSDRAIRARTAEDALDGQGAGDDAALERATAALDAMQFDGDLNASAETKKHLAKVLLKRAVRELQ